MALSSRAKRVQLRLDSGQIVGAADRLGVVGLPATSAAIMDVDKAFAAGKLPASLVQKLEDILQKLAAKVSGNGQYHLRTVNNVIHVSRLCPAGSSSHLVIPARPTSSFEVSGLSRFSV